MKKIILSISALLLTSSHLVSANADSCANSFSGFYAGVQAGMNRTAGDHTVTGGGSGTNKVLGGDTKHSSSKKAFLGGLFAGYGMGVGSCTYFGGEVYLNLSKTNLLINKGSIGSIKDEKETANNTYNFGVKARFGYTFSQKIMAFIGLGLERAKWQIKDTSPSFTPFKASKSSFVFAPSVGVDMFVSNNFFARAEFTYVFGPKVTIQGSNTAPIVLSGQTYKLKASQQRLALGVGYKF